MILKIGRVLLAPKLNINMTFNIYSQIGEVIDGVYETVPDTPTLTSPSDTATVSESTTSLVCSSESNTDLYRFQIDTVNTFDSGNLQTLTNTVPSVSTPTLTSGTTYYWRARTENTAGNSAYATAFSFDVALAPDAPNITAPSASQVLNTKQPTVTWGAVSGATSYDLQIDTDSGFGSPFIDETGLTGTSQSVTLWKGDWGTTYYARMRTYDGSNYSDWSASRTFSLMYVVGNSVAFRGMTNFPNNAAPNGTYVSFRFTAITTSEITEVGHWNKVGAPYSGGDGGDNTMEIRGDNGSGFPDFVAAALASEVIADPLSAGTNPKTTVSPTASVNGGDLLHFVHKNTDGSPGTNFYSINAGDGDSAYQPTQDENTYSTVRSGSDSYDRTPVFYIKYSDSSVQGQSIIDSSDKDLYTSNRKVKYEIPTSAGPTGIVSLFVACWKNGTPADDLDYTVTGSVSGSLATGSIAASAIAASEYPTWVRIPISSHDMVSETITIEFSSPNSVDSSNCPFISGFRRGGGSKGWPTELDPPGTAYYTTDGGSTWPSDFSGSSGEWVLAAFFSDATSIDTSVPA